MTSLDLVRKQALEVLREIESPFVKWAFFKAYSARFGSQLPFSDCGYLTLCDFLESIPGVRLASSPDLYSFKEQPTPRRQSSAEDEEEKEATVTRETSLSCSLATEEDEKNPVVSDVSSKSEEPPATVAPPMTMELFRKQALTVAKKANHLLSLREFAIAYCKDLEMPLVPFRALGFHSIAACLMAIPELVGHIRLDLERELLECAKPLTQPFPPNKIAKRYCSFKNKQWVPFRAAGYNSVWDIISCLPGVVDNGDGRLRYGGDRRPDFDVIPRSDRLPAQVAPEKDTKEPAKEEPQGSRSTGIGSGSDKEDQPIADDEKPKQASESLPPASEETASTTSSTPSATGSRNDSRTATDQSLPVSSPTSSCQPAVIAMPPPASRNECVGRFITSLLDEAEKRGVNVAEMTKRIINAALDYKE